MESQMIEIDPAHILADDNSRFNIKPSRIEAMAQSIIEAGRVRVPVEVELLDPKQGKFTHRLTAGFIRHAAASKLNAEQKAGIKLPAIVASYSGSLDRLKTQLSENMDRENQTPMDQAVAIRKLMDEGVSRGDIRRIFSRPGGKKGAVQPASNAWVNIVLGFLDLPKSIQAKIHDGSVGVKAAYQLGKVPADKRQAVLDAAEAERAKELAGEEKDEEKYLEAQRKVEAAKGKVIEIDAKIDAAKVDVTKHVELVAAKKAELEEVKKLPYLAADDKEKKVIQEKMGAANNDVKSAEKLLRDVKNVLAKLHEDKSKAEETAEEKAKQLDATKKPVKKADKGKGKAAGVSDADIKTAAKAAGTEGAGYVPLNLSEIRVCLKAIRSDKHPIVASIGTVLCQAFDGVTTEKELLHDLSVITGEETGELTQRTAPTPKVKAKK